MANLFPEPGPTEALFLSSNTLSQVAFDAAHHPNPELNSNLVALLFSAAWFEGSLNEAIEDLRSGRQRDQTERSNRVRLAADAADLGARYTSIDRKLRVLCAAATDAVLVDAQSPWSDLFLLIRLRNWVVHLRPERLNVRAGRDDEPSSLVSTRVHDLVSDLLAAGAIDIIPRGHMVPVITAIQLPGVGPWAYRAAYRGLEALDGWLPERYRKLTEHHRSP